MGKETEQAFCKRNTDGQKIHKEVAVKKETDLKQPEHNLVTSESNSQLIAAALIS